MTARKQVCISDLIEGQPSFSRFGLRLIVLSCLVTFVDGFDMQGISFLAPYLVEDFDLDAQALGSLFSSGLFGAMLGGPLGGFLGDRWGRRPTTILFTLLSGFLTASLVLSPDFATLMVLRFLGGITIGGVIPVIWALNLDFAPQARRSTTIVIIMIGYFLGSAVSGPLTVWLAPQFGWEGLWLLGGAVTVLSALVLVIWLPESPYHLVRKESDRHRLAATLQAVSPRRGIDASDSFIAADTEQGVKGRSRLAQLFEGRFAVITPLLWVAYIASSSAMYFKATWGPTLYEMIGFTRSEAAYIATAAGLFGAVLGLVVGKLIDRFGLLSLVIVALLAIPPLLAIGLAPISLAAIAATVLLSGALISGVHSGMHSIAGRYYPSESRASGAGWATSIAKFGSVAAPTAGGLILASGLPIRQSFVLLAACPLLLAVALAVIYPTLRKNDLASRLSS